MQGRLRSRPAQQSQPRRQETGAAIKCARPLYNAQVIVVPSPPLSAWIQPAPRAGLPGAINSTTGPAARRRPRVQAPSQRSDDPALEESVPLPLLAAEEGGGPGDESEDRRTSDRDESRNQTSPNGDFQGQFHRGLWCPGGEGSPGQNRCRH